jgi:hypothetical protein
MGESDTEEQPLKQRRKLANDNLEAEEVSPLE